MNNAKWMVRGAALLAAAVPGLLSAQARVNQYGYPEKLDPRPTTAAITVEDLMTRSYIFADDSMQGRQAGRVGNRMGTDYIASELRRLGIEPGGENGGYFQTLPYIQRKFTDRSTLAVNGTALRFNADFVPVPGNAAPAPLNGVQVIYGGVAGDTTAMITAEQAAGKFVILSPAAAGTVAARPMAGGRGAMGGGGWMARLNGAVAVATVNLDELSPAARAAINEPMATFAAGDAVRAVEAGDAILSDRQGGVAVVRDGQLIGGKLPAGMSAAAVKAYTDSLAAASQQAAGGARQGGAFGGGAPAAGTPPVQFRLTAAAAERLLGRPVSGAAAGATGGSVAARFDFVEQKTDWGRNVVGIIRGSDPALRGQFVAIGAHNDHVGFRGSPVDHDSLRAGAVARLKLQMETGDLLAITPEQAASVKINIDSLRAVRPARPDSINNGADDDGSGSMAVLEIAEWIQSMPVKPKRSVVFVWHTAEESGMHGSRHFSNNPSVPVDSIVTAINVDMIGRGRAEDVIGGGDFYTGVLGADRLAADLSKTMHELNDSRSQKIHLDDRFDDPTIGTPVNGVVTWPGYQNLYNRSDHTRYAEKCIPIVFFFTGLHADYHQVTDEAQYLDYPHYANITRFIGDLVVAVGNRDQRPALDGICVRR